MDNKGSMTPCCRPQDLLDLCPFRATQLQDISQSFIAWPLARSAAGLILLHREAWEKLILGKRSREIHLLCHLQQTALLHGHCSQESYFNSAVLHAQVKFGAPRSAYLCTAAGLLLLLTGHNLTHFSKC